MIKTLTKLNIFLLIIAVFSCNSNAKKNQQKQTEISPYDTKVDSVMSLMTLQEKIGQTVMYSGGWSVTGPTVSSNNKKYIDDIKNKILFSGKETLSKIDRYNEYLMTGLRTVWGVSLDLLESDFGEKFKNHFLENSREYINSDLIVENNGVYTTTKKGKFLADGIASNMFIIDLN